MACVYLDQDECEVGNGGCEQLCNNTIGSFYCDCVSGYILDTDSGKMCNGMISLSLLPVKYY